MAKTTKRAGRKAPPAKRVRYSAPEVDADEGEDQAEQKANKRAAEESIDEVLEDCDSPWDISDIREEYEAGFGRDKDNQDNAYLDLKYVAGDPTVHWDPDAWQQRIDEARPALIVNQCPQFVRQVTGDLRQMRPAIKCMPIDDRASQDMAAKEIPALIRYVERRSDAAGIYFQSADQQVGAGIGHWMVTHEYASQRTFAQELRIAPIPDGIAVVWDPDAVLLDRSDADFVFVPWDMSARAFKKKYPGMNASGFSSSQESCFTSWVSDDHVRVSLYFRKRKCTLKLVEMPDGKIHDVTEDPAQAAELTRIGGELKTRDGHKVYRLLVSAHEILEEAEEWPGPDIPVVPLIGEEITIGRHIVRRGIIRVLRDVQRIYNYAISTQTEIVALQPKAPYIGTRKQFEKYVDQWETANSRNWPYLEYTPDGAAPPPQRAKPPEASQGLAALSQETVNAMYSTTGIYPSALGAKSNETSGKAIMARQREGDTGTYVYIDAFGRAICRTGQIIVNMAPRIYDTHRRLQIAGDDGKPDQIELNKKVLGEDGLTHQTLNDLTIGAYEISIEMGPALSTKREEAREGMTEMLRTLGPQVGGMFLDLFVKAQDWPLADKIAERARMMLPKNVRDKEDAEAGKPPQQEPPPEPTPEQIEQQKLEQSEMLDRQEKEANANRKHDLDKIGLEVKQQEIALQMKQLDAKAREMELGQADAARSHEQAMAGHAVSAVEASADPRMDQIVTMLESVVQSVEKLATRVDEIAGEVQQMGTDHEAYVTEQQAEKRGAAEAAKAAPPPPDHTPALLELIGKLGTRPQPKGVKRTKEGMTLDYGEEPTEPGAPA
jgi:hypothetical protein